MYKILQLNISKHYLNPNQFSSLASEIGFSTSAVHNGELRHREELEVAEPQADYKIPHFPLFVLSCHTFTKEQDGNGGRVSMGSRKKRKRRLQLLFWQIVSSCTHLQGNLFSERRVGIGEGAGHPNAYGNPCGERHCQSMWCRAGGCAVLNHLVSASQA